MTFEERKTVQSMREQGNSVRRIALAVGKHRSTVYREIARGLKKGCHLSDRYGYSAELGQREAEAQRAKKGRSRNN